MLFDKIFQSLSQARTTADAWPPANLAKALPTHYCFLDLAQMLAYYSSSTSRNLLCALLLCLSHPERLDRKPGDEDSGQKIVKFVMNEALSPSLSDQRLAQKTGDQQHIEGGLYSNVESGLAVLRVLCTTLPAIRFDAEVLVTIAAYTDSNDLWTTETAEGHATHILAQQLGDDDLMSDFVGSPSLRRFLRCLFMDGSPAQLTHAGRLALYPKNDEPTSRMSTPSAACEDDSDGLAMKGKAATAFAWVVGNSSAEIISKHWSQFTPVLSAVLDSPGTKLRARGLVVLQAFLDSCPARLLVSTGVFEVFEQSILQTLLLLPNLTPESDSLVLLDPAYDAIICLARVSLRVEENGTSRQQQLLGKVVRQGILEGYLHVSDHIRIIQLLARQGARVVTDMGLSATTYLKDLLEMCTAIMTDPFLGAYPDCILEASKLLNSLFLSCWPRITEPEHLGKALQTLTICWLNMHDGKSCAEPTSNYLPALKHLSKAAAILSTILSATGIDAKEFLAPVYAEEPTLKGLFKGNTATDLPLEQKSGRVFSENREARCG